MPPERQSRTKHRGHIRRRGNSFQVIVYTGIDPVTGKPGYLRQSTTDEAEAQKLLTKMLREVDRGVSSRTRATLSTALDAWLKVHEADESTLDNYAGYARRYIKPVLGSRPLSSITPRVLEELYAELRRCRDLCDGSQLVDHRTTRPHECHTVRHLQRRAHDCAEIGCVRLSCRPHTCKPLAASTIRQVHFTISAALAAAMRWEWIGTNAALVAKKPRQPRPQPDPPSPQEAARIIEQAWAENDTWGTLVWLTMTTGMRRGEMLALRWSDIELDQGVLDIRRNYVWLRGRGVEKDTKTHQMRRIALDPATVEVLRAHRARYESIMDALLAPPDPHAFVFSNEPDAAKPMNPDWVSHRYVAMCKKLGINSRLHALRHYSATELLTAGVDLRTVAGRLGHGGGGATTLRVYAAWVERADREAAAILGGRLIVPGHLARP